MHIGGVPPRPLTGPTTPRGNSGAGPLGFLLKLDSGQKETPGAVFLWFEREEGEEPSSLGPISRKVVRCQLVSWRLQVASSQPSGSLDF